MPKIHLPFVRNTRPKYRFTADSRLDLGAFFQSGILNDVFFRFDMIPIVLGAYKDDYESALSQHSYLIVDEFTSIRELTDYIRCLDRNDTAYATYLAWKEHGKIYVS